MNAWAFLSPSEKIVLRFLHHISARLDTQETAMSELTDQLDAALAQLDTDESGIEAVFAAQQATITSLQNALAASEAGEAADQAELQKALDAITAANTKLSQLTGVPSTGTSTGTTSTGDAGAGASDPTAPAEPGVPSAPSDAVTVVGDPSATTDQAPSSTPADSAPADSVPADSAGSVSGDGWSDSTSAGSPGTLNDGDTNTDGAAPAPAGDNTPLATGEQEVDSTGTPTVS